MILDVELPGNRAVSLEGGWVTYWIGEGLPTYKGPIDELPKEVIRELLDLKVIRKSFSFGDYTA
jgi:hypothetical protein